MPDFKSYNPVRVVFGRNTLNQIGELSKGYGKKAMVVTTGKLFVDTGLIARIQKLLRESGVDSEMYYEISPNPKTTEIDKAAAIAKNTGCDLVIGVGGGSGMDAAKGIAISATHEGGLWKHCGVGEENKNPIIPNKVLPIFSVTTTSGTGSHVTPWAVFTNPETNEKPGMGGDFLFPKIAIVDPELMKSVPARLTAATGFDVLAHALEAYTSKLATPVTDLYAIKAMKLVGKYLVRTVKDGNDMEAREGMALADTFAGVSLSMAEVTLCHAMAHAIGGVVDAHHGEVLGIMSPNTIAFSMHSWPDRFKNVGRFIRNEAIVDSADINKELEMTLSEVKKIQQDIGITFGLSKVGVKEGHLEEIAKNTLYVTAGSVSNDAKSAGFEDVITLLRKSM
jgi:alcohol dehydrogenase